MKKLALTLILTGMLLNASATHIVGGEIMYKYLSDNGSKVRYRVNLFLYIDCINGQPGAIEDDKRGFINVFSYNKTFNTYTLISGTTETDYPVEFARTGPSRVSDVNYKCIKNKPDACVDKYTFALDIEVPINSDGYTISFERCCRNNSINNIVNPQSTGATYFTHIPGFRTPGKNNSPVFKSLPPNFLCTNAPLKFDHSATDDNGDSLVYELYQPFDGANQNDPNPERDEATNPRNLQNVIWENGYATYTNQIDGNPTLSIDRFTGKLTLTPSNPGQYVVGIKAIEFRNGVRIGETKRDFQFNVSNCQFDVVSSFFVPKFNCSGTEVSFTNRSQGGVTYKWNFGDTFSNTDTSELKDPKYTYSQSGNYTVRLITINTICTDTSDYDINVKKNFTTKIPDDTLICGPFTKRLKSNQPGKQYLWSTGETTPEIVVNKGGKYWLAVTDAPCISRDTTNITNDLTVLNLGPDSVICRDSFVQFTYEGKAGYKTYLWNDNSTDQTVFIPQLGTYWVSVTNQNDCPSSDSITFVLYPPPRVLLNDTLFCKGTSVKLSGINYSVKTKMETNYLWNTGDTSAIINTVVPGTYIVKVRNRLCTIFDTAVITHIETGLDLGNDTFYCGPVDRWLRPKKDYVKYVWHDLAEVVDYHATTPGKKKLTITTKEGCIESDSVFITQYPQIDGGLGNDTAICLSSVILLTASDSMASYLWNTGAVTRQIRISDQGLYKVTFTSKFGCINDDSIRITEQADALPIDMFMPNAFSPNDDNINEFYPGNHYSDPGSAYMLRLYNRWGEKIFESESPSIQWDGRIKDDYAPQDVYVYYVRYVGCDNVERWFRGTFTLIR